MTKIPTLEEARDQMISEALKRHALPEAAAPLINGDNMDEIMASAGAVSLMKVPTPTRSGVEIYRATQPSTPGADIYRAKHSSK